MRDALLGAMLLGVLGVARAATAPTVPPAPPPPMNSAPPPAPTVPPAPPAANVPPAPPAANVPPAPPAAAMPKAPPLPAVATPPPAPVAPAPPASASAPAKPAKARAPDTVTLTGPTVVIFHASRAEIAKTEPEPDEEKLAFRKDFEGGASKLQDAMKAHPQVKVIVSSADVVRFSDRQAAPVWRYSVGTGYGYVFYRPGKPLRVFAGARGGDGLVCEAARMFELKPRPPHCDP